MRYSGSFFRDSMHIHGLRDSRNPPPLHTQHQTRAYRVAVIIACVLFAGAAPEKQAIPFPDVEPGHIYADAIADMALRGIMRGDDSGFFRPEDPLLRSEFSKIITAAFLHSDALQDSSTKRFSDVPASAWYARYVNAAAAQEWLRGYPDGTFRPARTINVAEATTVLARAIVHDDSDSGAGEKNTVIFGEKVSPALREQSVHITIPVAPTVELPWFYQSLAAVSQRNAIPESVSAFDAPVTRGELAEMLYRLLNEITEKPSAGFWDIPCSDSDRSTAYSIASATNPWGTCILELTGPQPPDIGDVISRLPLLRSITIRNAGLTGMPEGILSLKRLEELALPDNAIQTLPAGIGALGALERLDLSGNRLQALPASLGNLTNLSLLVLTSNDLASLPDTIASLPSLSELHIDNNAFSLEEILRLRNLLPSVDIYSE